MKEYCMNCEHHIVIENNHGDFEGICVCVESPEYFTRICCTETCDLFEKELDEEDEIDE